MEGSFKQALLVLCFLCQFGGGDSVKYCVDPGTPAHGSRNQSHTGRFPPDSIVRFSCDHYFRLVGTKKLYCSTDGTWSGKAPHCIVESCLHDDLPLVPHAHVLDHVTSPPHAVGSSVRYTCLAGYRAEGSLQMICGKNGNWIGNITCGVVTCGEPPQISNGNVMWSSLNYSSTSNYMCNKGYVFRESHESYMTTKCEASGQWTPPSFKCVALCPDLEKPMHGTVVLPHRRLIYGVSATFSCDANYKIRGPLIIRCSMYGSWTAISPTCEINSCGPPGYFTENGSMTSEMSDYQFGTVVEFKCHDGFHLVGPTHRVCQTSGRWSETKNPDCIAIICSEPGKILHGNHKPSGAGTYRYGTIVKYFCDPKYHIYGTQATGAWTQEARLRCGKGADGKGQWKGVDGKGQWKVAVTLECISLSLYEERCKSDGSDLTFTEEKQPQCYKPTADPTEVETTVSRRNQDLDTLTIVTASAGSTLGALVILLSVLICLKKLARRRRIRHHSSRGRHYSDDDRIAFIATYTSDVHFILPSYDEAMSQVERSPPPFDLVVPQGADRSTNTNNNDAAVNDGLSAGVRDNTNTVAAFGNPLYEPSSDSERQINIVSNPLADGERADAAHAGQGATAGQCSGAEQDVLSRSESFESETDSESGSNETRPLIGEADRAVMV